MVNERPERASAQILARQLLWSEAHPRATLGYPTTDLSAWAITPALDFLEGHGATVRCGAVVQSLSLDARGYADAVHLQTGETLKADGVILAVPPEALTRLAAETPLCRNVFFGRARHISASPITGIDLWLDRPLPTQHPFEGLIGTTVEWVFDREKMWGAHDGAAPRQTEGHY